MNAAVYTRVSTDKHPQDEFSSCEAQEARIRSFVSGQKHMRIHDVYSDSGYTGANLNRPALSRLLDDIHSGHINLIISYNPTLNTYTSL